MDAIKVNCGIYIDLDCTAIQHVQSGYFICAIPDTSDMAEEYEADLGAFLAKWYPGLKADRDALNFMPKPIFTPNGHVH